MGKVVVAIRPASSKGGKTGISRYIAESKRDQEKEGLRDKEARPLFSAKEDKLTYWQADQILGKSTGTVPEKEDVVHVVISLEPDDFKDIGKTVDEQKEVFREIVREAAEVIEKEIDFRELNFIAGIHLNTDNPHVHLAFSRDGIDVKTGELSRLEHLPKSLLPHHEKDSSGKKVFVEGRIAETVGRGIERARERVRSLETPEHERLRQDQKEHDPDQSKARDQNILFPEQQDRESHPEIEVKEPVIEKHDRVPEQTLNLAPQGADQARDLEEPALAQEQAVAHAHLEPLVEIPAPAGEHEHDLRLPEDPGYDHPDTHSWESFEEQDTVLHFDGPDFGEGPESEHTQEAAGVDRERFILGRSMVARGEVERIERELNAAYEHGDKRRFRVFDASHGRTRQISEFDIHRRADARASTTVRDKEIADPDKRHAARQSQYEAEVEHHEKAIHDHRIILSKTITKLEKMYGEAKAEHAGLKSQVRVIQRHYRVNGLDLPTPLLSRKEIGKLQDQAVAARDPARVKTLENIRLELAREHGSPPRTDQEIARLEGQLLHARTEQAARHERVEQFERNRHQTRWEIDGEKYSLADIDRRISEAEGRTHLLNLNPDLRIKSVSLLPSTRREAADEAERLREVRATICERIEERRQELGEAEAQAGRMTSVLSEIHVAEQERQRGREGERLEKTLTRGEINQIIEHATLVADSSMLHQAFILEAQFEDRLPDDKKTPLPAQAARAFGREVMSEIALAQADRQLKTFEEKREFTPVLVKDIEGREVTARPFDFRSPRNLVVWVAEKATESEGQRHLRSAVNQAVAEQHERLKEGLEKATECHELTRSVADSYREHVLATGERLPEATFSPKQIVQLEIYAARQHDPAERARLEILINHAELSGRVQSQPTYDKGKAEQGEHAHQSLPHYDEERGRERDPTRHRENSPGLDADRTLARQDGGARAIAPATQLQPSAQPQQAPAREGPDLDLLH